MHQLKVKHNPNYLNSLWLGLTAPLLNLWFVVLHLFVVPLFAALMHAFRLFVIVPIIGVMGGLTAEDITPEEAVRSANE